LWQRKRLSSRAEANIAFSQLQKSFCSGRINFRTGFFDSSWVKKRQGPRHARQEAAPLRTKSMEEETLHPHRTQDALNQGEKGANQQHRSPGPDRTSVGLSKEKSIILKKRNGRRERTMSRLQIFKKEKTGEPGPWHPS